MVIIRQTDLSSIKQNVKKVESLYITAGIKNDITVIDNSLASVSIY